MIDGLGGAGVMNDLIESRLSELKEKPFAELSELDAYQAEKVRKGGKVITVAVWKDMVGGSELQIVVQTYRRWFLGIGKMDAEGFKVNDCGVVQDLKKEEIYEFI